MFDLSLAALLSHGVHKPELRNEADSPPSSEGEAFALLISEQPPPRPAAEAAPMQVPDDGSTASQGGTATTKREEQPREGDSRLEIVAEISKAAPKDIVVFPDEPVEPPKQPSPAVAKPLEIGQIPLAPAPIPAGDPPAVIKDAEPTFSEVSYRNVSAHEAAAPAREAVEVPTTHVGPPGTIVHAQPPENTSSPAEKPKEKKQAENLTPHQAGFSAKTLFTSQTAFQPERTVELEQPNIPAMKGATPDAPERAATKVVVSPNKAPERPALVQSHIPVAADSPRLHNIIPANNIPANLSGMDFTPSAAEAEPDRHSSLVQLSRGASNHYIPQSVSQSPAFPPSTQAMQRQMPLQDEPLKTAPAPAINHHLAAPHPEILPTGARKTNHIEISALPLLAEMPREARASIPRKPPAEGQSTFETPTLVTRKDDREPMLTPQGGQAKEPAQPPAPTAPPRANPAFEPGKPQAPHEPFHRGDTSLASAIETTGPRLSASHTNVLAPRSPPIAVQIHQHIAAFPAPASGHTATYEIALRPEELGTIRLQLAGGETSVALHISAERDDTLHLLRRHAEDLSRELRELGYDDVSFAFSSENASQTEDDSPPPDQPEEIPAAPGAQSNPEYISTRVLDKRL